MVHWFETNIGMVNTIVYDATSACLSKVVLVNEVERNLVIDMVNLKYLTKSL